MRLSGILQRLRRPYLFKRRIYDIHCIDFQKGAYLAVYWKDQKEGNGPALSLYVRDQEVFKADCFGPARGHYHFNLKQTGAQEDKGRIFFQEKSVAEQIDQAVKVLTERVSEILLQNKTPRVKTFQLDKKQFSEALSKAKIQMTAYAALTH